MDGRKWKEVLVTHLSVLGVKFEVRFLSYTMVVVSRVAPGLLVNGVSYCRVVVRLYSFHSDGKFYEETRALPTPTHQHGEYLGSATEAYRTARTSSMITDAAGRKVTAEMIAAVNALENLQELRIRGEITARNNTICRLCQERDGLGRKITVLEEQIDQEQAVLSSFETKLNMEV